MRIPYWLLKQLPMWDYICPKCKREVKQKSHKCPYCGENYGMPLRVPPRVLKDSKALEEYVHKHIFPKVSASQREYLTKFFTTIFSDGFQSGDFSAWTATGGDGTHSETIVTSPVHHGSYAAKLYVEGDSWSYAYKRFTQQTPVYFRVYLQSSATPNSGWRLELLYLYYSAYYGYGAYVRWFNDAGTLKWELAVNDDGADWHYARSTTPTINTNQWYCVELKVDSATAGNGEARLYVDGTEIASLTGLTITETGKPDTAEIHAYNYPVTTSVYFDCVVVADTYIGPEVPYKPKGSIVVHAKLGE
jgi:hypothetical protein